MLVIDKNIVENEIIRAIEEIGSRLKIENKIDNESIPSFIGFSSIALITVMGVIEEKLNITIPNNCYIFIDQDYKKLSIKEATDKLIKIAKKNGK